MLRGGVHVVDQHAPARRPEKAVELAHERRFSAAVLADDRQAFAALDEKIDIFESLGSVGIAE